MEKKILTICFLTLIILLLIILSNSQEKDYNEDKITSNSWIKSYNDSVFLIKNLSCDVYVQKGLIRLNGEILYEKPKNTNVQLYFLNIKEILIGSNENEFWFWSRELGDALYFGSYEESYRLKALFNPIVIRKLLSIDKIESVKFFNLKKDLVVLEKIDEDTFLEIIVRNNLIINKNIIHKNIKIASLHFLENQKVQNFTLPKKIEIDWHEERITTFWELSNVKLNINIKENFEKPLFKNNINLKNY